MIECPNCHTPNSDERAGQNCIKCGQPLPAAETAATEVGLEENPFEQLRSYVDTSSREAEPEEEWGRDRARRKRAYAQEEEDEESPLDPNHLDAITEYGRARSIISVIGFVSSGKTFLVNRLRDRLAQGGWKRSPQPARIIPTTPAGIELTRFVPTDIRVRQGRSHGYIVVDCAGESFKSALNRLDQAQARSYLAAIAFASAYILVIKAEDLLAFSNRAVEGLSISERNHREFVEDVLLQFDEIISAIVVSGERLRQENPEEFLRRGLSEPELKNVLDQNRVRCRQPLCIAFSLADRLEAMEEQNDAYDADPFLFALRHAPTLVRAVDRTFDHYRFDFLSAFYGHKFDEDNKESLRPNYQHPSYGAQDAFLWLHELLRPRSGFSRLGRFAAGQVPTRHLVTLRRKVDPVFDREWRETWTR